jgi:hypothetical protein
VEKVSRKPIESTALIDMALNDITFGMRTVCIQFLMLLSTYNGSSVKDTPNQTLLKN